MIWRAVWFWGWCCVHSCIPSLRVLVDGDEEDSGFSYDVNIAVHCVVGSNVLWAEVIAGSESDLEVVGTCGEFCKMIVSFVVCGCGVYQKVVLLVEIDRDGVHPWFSVVLQAVRVGVIPDETFESAGGWDGCF